MAELQPGSDYEISPTTRKTVTQSVTLGNATTSADYVNIEGFSQIGVQFPAGMLGTTTVQVSHDGTTFVALKARDGSSVLFTSHASTGYDIPELAAWPYMRFSESADNSTRAAIVVAKV